jgi:hypothetical protein
MLGTTISHKGVPMVYRHHTPNMVSPHGRHLTMSTQREYPSNNEIPINMISPLSAPACLPYMYLVLITTPSPSTLAIPCNTTTRYQDRRAKFPTPQNKHVCRRYQSRKSIVISRTQMSTNRTRTCFDFRNPSRLPCCQAPLIAALLRTDLAFSSTGTKRTNHRAPKQR